MRHFTYLTLLLISTWHLLSAGPAWAQETEHGDAASSPAASPANPLPRDPPARVGRLSLVEGTVSFKPAGVDEWVTAVLNRPVTRGDSVWTDGGGRAEIHVGTLAIRLGSKTSLYISNLDDKTVQLSVTQGSAAVHIRDLGREELVEVDLPNGAATLRQVGEYRVNVNEAGDQSSLTVRRGSAEILVDGSALAVPAGKTGELTGQENATHQLAEAPEADSFDAWCAQRDGREEHPTALRYVSRSTVGYEDLDDNGRWQSSPEYGSVWVPTVPTGWAPYHSGHWAWVDPWGWTWVDDMPWGFAPFHYGRWAYWGSSWAWVPGPIVARPCYAPALVAFVGGGIAVGATVSWFPLGPREVFVPGYGVSYNYVRSVNGPGIGVTSVTQVSANQTYANRAVGVTSVTSGTFQSGRPVGVNTVTVNQATLHNAPVSNSASVAPQRASVMGAASATSAHPPLATQNRQVVTHASPPPAPTPFAQRQSALQHSGGHPVSTLPQSHPESQPSRGGAERSPSQHAVGSNVPHESYHSMEIYRPAQQHTYRPAPASHGSYHPAPIRESRPAPAPHPFFQHSSEPHFGGGGGGGGRGGGGGGGGGRRPR